MRYSCILFDLDQTLLLHVPTITEKLHDVLCQNSISHTYSDVEKAFADCEFWIGEQVQEENRTGIRMDDETFIQKLLDIYAVFFDIAPQDCDVIKPVIAREYDREYRLMPDALFVLDTLKRAGVKLGIVSNNYSSIRKTLDELQLTSYFDCIIISKEVGIHKPDPAILRLACEKCGVETSDVMYVGDHPFDIVCAHGAGMHAAWIPPNRFFKLPDGDEMPEYKLGKLSDLLEAL